MTSAVNTGKSHPKRWLFFRLHGALLALCIAVAGCAGDQREYARLAGSTMGTSYNLVFDNAGGLELAELQVALDTRLEAINDSMSTYRPASEISRFNRLEAGQGQALSVDFVTVLRAALDIGQLSDGAYDVTVGPLVDLWGFGPGERALEPPLEERIEEVLAAVGQQHLDLQGDTLRKTRNVQLDFSSIAKGFGVDALAAELEARGVVNYMVEIGGELRLSGVSPRGDHWRIAVEKPIPGVREVAGALSVTDVGVATSGDYRNFFEFEGRRYSHTVDPRTGRPVAHDLASVTVLHPSAMLADGWATALTAMGADAALALAERESLAVYLIRRYDPLTDSTGSAENETGPEYKAVHSSAFAPYLEEGMINIPQ